MVFGYITLFVAFVLSAVAAYYSVLGLVAIFSAAVIPVMVMGGALETGKIIAAMWLHRNWHRAGWTYKAYLLPSLLALMFLTSMGTFGFLSKAHSDQNLVSGDIQSKIAIYDEKIRISRENIDANRAALKQLDAAVDQIMGRSTTEQGAERSVQIRRQQGPERQRLIREIEAEQKKISSLNEERAPIAAEVRKVEAEVGPIKYIAALVYDDVQDTTVLERAVRWVIILIVSVFDPLAIVLILAGTRHIEWERELKKQSKKIDEVIEEPVNEVIEEPTIEQVVEKENPVVEPPPPKFVEQVYLKKPWVDKVPGVRFPHQVYTTTTTTTTRAPLPKYTIEHDGKFVRINNKMIGMEVLAQQYPEIVSEIEERKLNESLGIVVETTRPPLPPAASFGTSYPENPTKGQIHINIGVLPSRLVKFNGVDWIELDKSISDSYTYNEAYIQYLVNQIGSGVLSLEDLTTREQELVETYLIDNKQNDQSTNNPT